MSMPMITILALCGVMFVLRNVLPDDSWRSRLLFLAKALSLYFLIGVLLIVLYLEVVLRWLVF
ncbi:hypothetical protein Arash_gp33c [Salmonella phage Arash]|nr:hypothetical protein Arash_gp33c [Salmonella phage Arash]